jgi:hypothetical protein
VVEQASKRYQPIDISACWFKWHQTTFSLLYLSGRRPWGRLQASYSRKLLLKDLIDITLAFELPDTSQLSAAKRQDQLKNSNIR